MRFSRPWLAALATMLVATGGLAACSPNPSGGASGAGVVTIARTGDIDLLDPARATAQRSRVT